MVLIKKIKADKIPKGYRLKRSTHKLIDKIQKILHADQDEVITRACELLYKEVNPNGNNSVNNKSTNKLSGDKSE